MNNAWLDAFPFMARQQAIVETLMSEYNSLDTYDVTADWCQFNSQHTNIDVFQRLRLFRQTRLAFIAQTDFQLPVSAHGLSMLKTSQLADFLVQQALAFAQQQMVDKYGHVVDHKGDQVDFVVLALGKLGTNELNYSSDIDLVFVSGGDGSSNGKRSLDAARYFERLGRQLIKLLDQYTGQGRVYRVDMRLRPFGSAAPLVCPAAALHHYIITEGREWERFAWMRARFVAGDSALATDVLSSVNPFIYRKHLDYSVFDSLAKIKRDMSLSAEDHDDDLKLGSGGIREIEFIVQSLQVTFGGRIPELQGVSIEPQFELLLSRQKIKAENAVALAQAWLFMRKLENLSQIQNDEQIHVVTQNQKHRDVLAQLMGCTDWSSCYRQWQSHRKVVQQLFGALFVSNDDKQQPSNEAARWIRGVMAVYFLQKMPQDKAERVQKILERASELADVDLLENGLLPILKAIIRRPSYLLMLLQEKSILPALLGLVKKNDYFVEAWVQHPALLELLFEPEMLPLNVEASFFRDDWCVQNNDELDEEQWMESVRFYKQRQQFKLIQTALTMDFPDAFLREGFSALASFFVRLVVNKGWHETKSRLGHCGLKAEQMMVLAYGSLGVSHMNKNSDLDLVLVVDADSLNTDQMLFLQRWAKRISHHLMVKMYHGVLYELDLQLRPNGNAGALVTSKKEFEKYQKGQAWIWEHAALIKAQVLGDIESQQVWFKQLKHEVLCGQVRDKLQVEQSMADMSDKLSQFGSQDHQKELLFLTQILMAAPLFPELLNYKNYVELVTNGVRLSILSEDLAESLLNKKNPI